MIDYPTAILLAQSLQARDVAARGLVRLLSGPTDDPSETHEQTMVMLARSYVAAQANIANIMAP
jgi:hypothetical protein